MKGDATMVLELPDVWVDGDSKESLCEGAAAVVAALRPSWHRQDMMYKVYTNGITNKLVGVWHRLSHRDEQLLVRVYGRKTEMFIDRELEKKNIQLLQPYGCGPQLYCSFSNGLCYSYTPGEPLTTTTVTLPVVYEATARHMATLHAVPLQKADSEPMLFTKLKKFLDLLPELESSDRLKYAVKKGYSKQFLVQEALELHEAVESLSCPVTMCHNDLLLANIIWRREDNALHFIDFEYAGPNYQLFDVANHFCEFAGVDTVDYSLYPSEEFQKEWLIKYLSHLPCSSAHSLLWWTGAVFVFALTAHLFWGTWALLQGQHSTIDFDFVQYSTLRLDEYKRRKVQFLAAAAKTLKD